LLWDDTKSTNCPGRVGFAKARYMNRSPYKNIKFQEKIQMRMIIPKQDKEKRLLLLQHDEQVPEEEDQKS
jgi:hypothetical protein